MCTAWPSARWPQSWVTSWARSSKTDPSARQVPRPGAIQAFLRENARISLLARRASVTQLNKHDTVQFPEEPTFADRVREMTRGYRYRFGPKLLLGALFAAHGTRPWQAVGIVKSGLVAAEGLFKIRVGQERTSGRIALKKRRPRPPFFI